MKTDFAERCSLQSQMKGFVHFLINGFKCHNWMGVPACMMPGTSPHGQCRQERRKAFRKVPGAQLCSL